jgi:hypothetical protein
MPLTCIRCFSDTQGKGKQNRGLWAWGRQNVDPSHGCRFRADIWASAIGLGVSVDGEEGFPCYRPLARAVRRERGEQRRVCELSLARSLRRKLHVPKRSSDVGGMTGRGPVEMVVGRYCHRLSSIDCRRSP